KGSVARNPGCRRPVESEVAESARHDVDLAVAVEIAERDRGIVACLTFQRVTSKLTRPGLFDEDHGVGFGGLSPCAVLRFAQAAGGHGVQIATSVDVPAQRAVSAVDGANRVADERSLRPRVLEPRDSVVRLDQGGVVYVPVGEHGVEIAIAVQINYLESTA